MDVLLLGPVEAHIDSRPIALGARKQRAVLAMLALESGRTVSAERLAEGLWGEARPASATKMVQVYVHQLRRAIDGSGAEIVTRGRGYELRQASGEVDAARVEHLLNDGRPREALALWRGDALADLAGEPFAAAEIRRLDELHTQAAEAAIEADLAAGRHTAVLAELSALLDAEPLRERLHALRILALYRSGRQAEALEAYRDARALLVENAGIEPGAELQRLQQAVLHHDPALEVPPSPIAETLAEPGRGHRGRRYAVAGVLAFAALLAVATATARRDGLDRVDEDHVGRIDGDRIATQLPVGHGASVALAAGGSVWVANTVDGTVSRIEDGHVTSITVRGAPAGLAFGHGSLWIADGDGHRVVQVDATANKVVQEIEAGNAPRALTVAAGALWVASGVDQAVRRIDLGSLAARTIRIGSSPTAIASGAGAIWVAGEEAGQVTRIDSRTGAARPPLDVGNGPSALAVGAGAVWVVNRHDGTLSRIDPATNAVTWTGGVGRDPTAVAVGDGAVWVAGGDAVVRVDPEEPHGMRTIAAGSNPAAIAAGSEGVWLVGAAPQSSHRGGTLRVRIPLIAPIVAEVDWLQPRGWSWETWHVASLAYDGLVGYRRVGGAAGTTLVGALADGVPEPSADGRTYVFTLRPRLRYADGRPVRAGDFRSSMERMMVRSRPPYFDGIVGARRCARRCDLSAGIESDERARTITVHLVAPDSDFLHKLTTAFAFVVPAGAGRELPPGTGPYRVASWDQRTGGALVRNPYFRARPSRPAGFADRIEVAFVDRASIETQIAAVRPGGTDVLVLADPFGSHITGARLKVLTATAAGRLHSERAGSTDWMFLNVRRPPFDDVRVRRALSYAVDRARIVELVGGGPTAAPTCQIVPAGLPGHRPYCPYTGDAWGAPHLARARALIAESGEAGRRVAVVVPDFRRSVGRYFVRLLNTLGLRASLRTLPVADYFRTVYASGVQIGFMGWSLDYVSASSFIQPHFTCSSEADRDPNNVSRFCDGALARDVSEAIDGRGVDPGVAWERADRRIVDLAPAVPLTNRRSLVLTSERVGNVQSHPLWFTLLDQLWVR